MHRTQNKSINTYPEPKSKLQEHKNFHMQSFTNHPNSNLRHLENRLYGCIAHDEYYIVCSWSKMRRSKNWWWWWNGEVERKNESLGKKKKCGMQMRFLSCTMPIYRLLSTHNSKFVTPTKFTNILPLSPNFSTCL